MDRIDSLRIFIRVVETASFTRAAESLRLPRSTVSTVIQELEARVGARLLNRTTRRVVPTVEGTLFHQRCLALLDEYEATEALFRKADSTPRGRLRINVPGRLGRLVIAPALPDFFARFPDIELEMGATDRAVDMVREGIDCVVRVGEMRDSSLVARRLGDLTLLNCASPDYLARHGTPLSPDRLDHHFAVNYASPVSGRIDDWEYVVDGIAHQCPMRAQVTVNDAESYIACCLAGLGLIQIPAYDVAGHLARGELVEVMPAWRAQPMPIALVYPHRRHLSRQLEVFLDWTSELFRQRVLLGAAKGE